MFDWISKNRDYFLENYTEIGDSYPSSYELQQQHGQFSKNAMVRYLRATHWICTPVTIIRTNPIQLFSLSTYGKEVGVFL